MATFSRSRTLKQSTVSPNLSRRSTGNLPLTESNARPKSSRGRRMAASLDASGTRKSFDISNWDVGKVESEYIRNLQQQIYFLELETNHLQDQLKKATVIPPKVTEEADRMMRKLKSLQQEVDIRSQDVMRKESQIMIAMEEKESAIKKMKDAEESFALEKKELVNEIVRLQKQLDRQHLESSKRDLQVTEIRKEADRGFDALQEAENRISHYRNEMDEKTEECNRLRIQLEEKRAECLKIQTEFQELDERFFRSDSKSKEQIGKDLREEIKYLKYECRQKEIAAEQDRALRNKISDDCAALVKENAALASQTLELQKQLDAERHFQDNKETRRHANIQELVTSKENEKHLQKELEHLKDQLRIERMKNKEATGKLFDGERGLARAKLRGTKLQSEVEELENLNSSQNEENIQLRRDKMILTDHVAELQAKLSEKEEELENVTVELNDFKSHTAQLESKIRMQQNMDSIKWEEFEKMADSLKQFSRSMSPLKASRSVQFD